MGRPVAGTPGSRAPAGNASGSGTASPSGRGTGIWIRGGQAGADVCRGVAGLHGGLAGWADAGPAAAGRSLGLALPGGLLRRGGRVHAREVTAEDQRDRAWLS